MGRSWSALALIGLLALVGCGGTDDDRSAATVDESVVEIVDASDDGVVREAGADGLVIDGCRIEPRTQCPYANLLGANLSGSDLSVANLLGVELSTADLSWANLRGANLQRADLRRANLLRADLSGADLSRAKLWGASLRAAGLQGVNFSGAILAEVDLRFADLSGANLSGVRFCRTTMPDGQVRNDHC